MADDRTPEQKAADEKLREAIEAMRVAYGEATIRTSTGEELPSVLNEYVILYHHTGFSSDGDRYTAYAWQFGPGDGVPWMHVMGLMTVCRLRMERMIRDTDGGDEG